jgi:hypothetical protein
MIEKICTITLKKQALLVFLGAKQAPKKTSFACFQRFFEPLLCKAKGSKIKLRFIQQRPFANISTLLKYKQSKEKFSEPLLCLYFNFAGTSPPLLCLYFNKVEILTKQRGVLRKKAELVFQDSPNPCQ